MSKEMLINAAQQDECRVAVVDDGVLEELYMERVSCESHVNNIYVGVVVGIESGIQAAFVDFGMPRHGFLHISDIHPRYYTKTNSNEKIGQRKGQRERPPIQSCIKRGQKIIVQVRKEGIGTKGPALTTYISLPGKYVVLMPWLSKVGVSQKIEDDDQRQRLKEMLKGIEKPKDAGYIIRTAGEKATKKDIEYDLAYLCRLWSSILQKQKSSSAPKELYQETNLALRAIRDIFNSSIRRIICDSEDISKKIYDLMSAVQPRYKRRISYYDGVEPLFYKYGIEPEVEKINDSRVMLKGGGSIVIEQTEALVAIDVNSGKMRRYGDIEKTALNTNIEAAKEIARQLRLRDLGGIIVCDFIDMERQDGRREVEKVFREAVKPDRAKYRILKMNGFCLVEMTRQRMRPSLERSVFQTCPQCGGTGIVKSYESIAIQILRLLQIELAKENVKDINITAPVEVADYLLNSKRIELATSESEYEKSIKVIADKSMTGESFAITSYDERARVVSQPE